MHLPHIGSECLKSLNTTVISLSQKHVYCEGQTAASGVLFHEIEIGSSTFSNYPEGSRSQHYATFDHRLRSPVALQTCNTTLA